MGEKGGGDDVGEFLRACGVGGRCREIDDCPAGRQYSEVWEKGLAHQRGVNGRNIVQV